MKFTPRNSMSAAELMAQLQRDPEFVRKSAEREANRQAIEAQIGEEEKLLLADLTIVGIRITSVWELVNTKSSYPEAIPVLARHLPRPYHPKILEGIARALTVREARGVAGRVILDELKQAKSEKSPEVRWTLANALTEAADVSMAKEIEALIADPHYADIRKILNLALSKIRGSEEAID